MVLKKEISLQIKNLLKENPHGLRITDIVKKVNINRNTAGRYLENLLVSGQVEMRRFGMAKIYTLSQRVPLSALLSISSELVLQLDNSLRIIYANEPFLLLAGTDFKNLSGKNIEFTPVALLFDEEFSQLLEIIRKGIAGKEWSGQINLITKDIVLFCHVAPTVFEDGRKGVSIIFEDITQQEKTEDALKKSESQYKSLIETTGTGYVILDKDGRVNTANQEYIRLTGRSTLGEIEGKHVTDWTAPYDLERNIREIERCMRQGKVRDLEIDYQKPDGTIQPIEINASVIQSGPDQIIQTLCRDITQRRKNENALRDSEDKYRKLVEISPDAVIIHQDGKISYVNPAAFKLLGASHSDQIIGKNILDFIHPDFRESVMKNIEKDLRGEISLSTELHMLRLDGVSIIVEGRGIKTNLGGKPAIQVAIRDVSESRRVEKILRDSEDKYRTLIERANDGIVVIQDNIVKMCNHYITEFWGGGSLDQILGRNFTDFIHPDALSDVIDRYNRRIAGESLPSIYESILKRKDGSRFFAELNAGIISYEGRPANLIIVRDINERKRTANALRESDATARALMNAPTDSVILTDIHRKILALNETAARRLGRKSDELVGMVVDDLMPKEVMKTRKPLMDQVIEKKTLMQFEDERDGRWYDTVAYPVVSENGEVQKIAIIARDITEQKTFEKRLRESEQMYKSLLEQTFDAIAIHKEGKIAFLNDRAAKILGASRPKDLMGKSIFEFIHPDSRKDLEDRIQKLTGNQGTPVPVITEKFIRTDGSTVTVEVLAISFDDNGTPAFRVAFREISPCNIVE